MTIVSLVIKILFQNYSLEFSSPFPALLLSKVLGHHKPPKQLQYALKQILQIFGKMNTVTAEDTSLVGVLMLMLVESAVEYISPKFSIGVHLGCEPLCPVDGISC